MLSFSNTKQFDRFLASNGIHRKTLDLHVEKKCARTIHDPSISFTLRHNQFISSCCLVAFVDNRFTLSIFRIHLCIFLKQKRKRGKFKAENKTFDCQFDNRSYFGDVLARPTLFESPTTTAFIVNVRIVQMSHIFLSQP